MHSLSHTSNSPALPEWYQIYFAAVLEVDESKAFRQIERATKAIVDRLHQLSPIAAEHSQELQDLTSALTYLQLLFENIDNEGKRADDFNYSCSHFPNQSSHS